MESLTDKEATVLELMAQGEDMLAIGNWEPIIESLAEKGYARLLGNKWYRATPAGEAAFVAFENGLIAAMIDEHNQKLQAKTTESKAVGELPCPP